MKTLELVIQVHIDGSAVMARLRPSSELRQLSARAQWRILQSAARELEAETGSRKLAAYLQAEAAVRRR